MDHMDEIDELEEYSLFCEFFKLSESVVTENVIELNESGFCDQNVEDMINDIQVDADADNEILQCIINLIELEYMLQDDSPKKRRKGERRWGVHPINQMRQEQGHFNNLFEEMLAHDHDKFFNYTRMEPERFQHLFELIESRITKCAPNAIPAKCRLLLTLRFLATGDSLKSLHYNFRVGISTAYYIIGETCDALWDVLQPIYLKFPEKNDWIRIESQFREKLNLPNCAGAMDGKLIEIFAPNRSGSLYFNYNKFFSENLLAVCDALKNFIYVDIGSYGQQTDGGVLFNSTFGKRLDLQKLDFPPPTPLPHTTVPFPFFIIADSAFPLKENLLTPYAGSQLTLSNAEINYNNEHSSVRKIIENTFGILVRRWQVFSGPIEMHPTNVDKIVKATVVLHNYIKSFDDPSAIRYMREDRFTYPATESLRSFYEAGLNLQAANGSDYASVVRDTYASYLMNVL
ncbi:hypothetical protein HA402_000683 [Bradysia odoriphaga]|nr:hypothetical protein HA402_000683 [Bradysia odoriphaga]